MRECGLKPHSGKLWKANKSHSLCGSVDWNLNVVWIRKMFKVTPYAGVWIETVEAERENGLQMSLLMRECGLKHFLEWWDKQCPVSLLMRECGLKHQRGRPKTSLWCHSLCGSVDWNSCEGCRSEHWGVTPYAGVWIETLSVYANVKMYAGHSLCGSVDWNSFNPLYSLSVYVSLLMRECGLKHQACNCLKAALQSLLMRECGLKPRLSVDIDMDFSHSLCGSVDWNW